MNFLDDSIKTWLPMYLATLMWYSVNSDVYESIQWSPLNPKFHFTEDHFKHNMAYYSQIVLPDSQINIICPNVATILTNLTQYPLRESLYENLWMVGEEEFNTCQINSSKRDNSLVLMCDKPDSLHFYTLHFIDLNTSLSSLHPVKSGNIYFLAVTYYLADWSISLQSTAFMTIHDPLCRVNLHLIVFFNSPLSIHGFTGQTQSNQWRLQATSNGTKESMNHTSRGHCRDPTSGISMRIKFNVCELNSTDARCLYHSQSVVNKTTSKDIQTCKNITIKRTSLERDFSQERFWEILAIILGFLLVLSFIIHSVLIICYCVKKNRRRHERQPSQSSQKGSSDEPLKSLIVDPHNKKSKHGRVSAAL